MILSRLIIKEATSYPQLEKIESLAGEILPEAYQSVIPGDHLALMIATSHSAKAIQKNISSKNFFYYTLMYEDLEIGYLGIEIRKNLLILSKLYILKYYRGKKIGKTALAFVDEFAKKRGLHEIELTVHKNNPATIQFYLKGGYEIRETLNHHFDNGHSLQGYRMVKSI